MRHFSTKMTHCAVPEILVNLYSMLGSSWNSIALGLNESSFWPYDYHFTNFLEKLIVLCIFRDILLRRLKVAILKFSLMYLINNVHTAASGIQLPFPLIYLFID